jgi:hypothetical protein
MSGNLSDTLGTIGIIGTVVPQPVPAVYLLLQSGVVVNRILWDGVTPYTPPPGTIVASDDGTEIGNTTAAQAVVSAALVGME